MADAIRPEWIRRLERQRNDSACAELKRRILDKLGLAAPQGVHLSVLRAPCPGSMQADVWWQDDWGSMYSITASGDSGWRSCPKRIFAELNSFSDSEMLDKVLLAVSEAAEQYAKEAVHEQ